MASGLAIGLEQIDPQIGRGRTVESRHLAFQALAEDPLQMRLEPFRQVIGDCAGHLRVAQGPADKAAHQSFLVLAEPRRPKAVAVAAC